MANFLCYYLEKDYINNPTTEDKNIDVIVVLGHAVKDINALKRMKIAGSFAYGAKNCFYSGSEEPNYFVCFEDNKIVNFVKKK